MAAQFEDAQAGWQVYRQSGFELTRDEINLKLRSLGYRPIAERTYTHYGKLRRFGYRRYMAINQLDVKTLRDPLWDDAVRQRYIERAVEIPVVLRFLGDDDLESLDAQVVELSDARAVAQMGTDPRERFSVRTLLIVEFTRIGLERLARVRSIDSVVTEGAWQLVLDFTSLTSTHLLLTQPTLAEGSLSIRATGSTEEPYLGDTIRALYWLFQSIEAARVICDEILAAQDPEGRYVLRPPVVERLSVSSPLDLGLLGSIPWIALIVFIIDRALAWRKTFYEASEAKESARKLRIENARAELEQQFDLPRLRAQLIREIADLLRSVGITPESTEPDARRMYAMIRRQLLPSVLEFIEEVGDTLEITSRNELPDLGAGDESASG